MSNVIAFRRPPKTLRPHRVAAEDALEILADSYMTVSSTVLLEGIDDIDAAINKAVRMLRAMPDGKARDLAHAELEHIRIQLAAARRVSDGGRGDFDPAA